MRVTAGLVLGTILLLGVLTVASAQAQEPGYAVGAAAFARGDYARAHEIWQPLAAANDVRAQYGEGLLHANGWGVPRDMLRAQHLYTVAAERGHPGAQYNLAVMRDTGNGVPRDTAQAAFWYTESARQGLPVAAYNLALMTLAGEGLRRDPARAVAWLERARGTDRAALIAALPAVSVATARANIRRTPGLDGEILARANRGDELRVFTQRAGWVEIWKIAGDGTPDTVGWIAQQLLSNTPDPNAKPVRLDRFEFGPLTDLDARRVRRPAPAPTRTTARSRSAAVDAEGDRLLRNSGWLVGLNTVDFGTPPPGEFARVATERLNVRRMPSVNASVIAQLRRDERVQVIDRRSGWRRIALPDDAGNGWVAAFLLQETPATADGSGSGRAARIGARNANLRAGPSNNATVLGQLHRGEPVRVIGERRGWREVRFSGAPGRGWVAAFLIAGEIAPPARAAQRAAVRVGESGG